MDANAISHKINPHRKRRGQEEVSTSNYETTAALSLLHNIFEHTPVGMAVISGPQFIFRLVSPAYRSILPDPSMEITGLPYSAVWPAEQGFLGEQLIRSLMETEKDLHFDRIEHRFPDGTLHSFSMRLCRMDWQDEQGVLIMVQDTTRADHANRLALEIAEEANRQAEEMNAVITAMAEAVVLFDARGHAIRANPAALALYGLDPVGIGQEELVSLLGISSPDGSPMQPEDFPVQHALLGQPLIGERLLLTGPDDEEHVLYVSASPLADETSIYGVITIWHDMTYREHLLEQLEIEQSRLKTIIENAPEAIVVADEEGRLVMANPAAERLLAAPLPYGEEISTHTRFHLCYPDGAPYDPRNLPLTCSALDGGRLFNVELLAAPKSGPVRHILASTAPIIDRKGNLNGAVGILQDITERKQAEETLRWNAVRLQLLASLSRAFAEAGLNYRDLLDTIVEQVGGKFGEFCILQIYDEETQRCQVAAVHAGVSHPIANFDQAGIRLHTSIDQGIAGWIYQTGQSALLLDVAQVQYLHLFPQDVWDLLSDALPKSLHLVSVPLRAHGRRIGVLNVIRMFDKKHYTESDLAFLQDLADRAALAVEDARLYEREAQRARELEALHHATTAMLSTVELEDRIVQTIVSAQEIFPTSVHGLLFMDNPETQAMEMRAFYGFTEDAMRRGQILTAIRPLVERAMQERTHLAHHPLEIENGMRYSAAATTLETPGSVLGVLALIKPDGDLFQRNDLTLLNSFAALASAALQNALLYSEVQRLATTDGLTGLYNRRKFFELGELEIHRYKRFQAPLSAIMFDLDNFKQINDGYGHGVGDLVLRTVALRSRASVRVIDILGRYGGDEFAILLPDADIHEAEEIAERIRGSVMEEAVQGPDGPIHVAISLGITQANSATDCLSTLLARADAALYSAKEKGKNRTEQR